MAQKRMTTDTTKCKVRILCPLPGVYSKYQPKVGEVYDADYKQGNHKRAGNRTFTVCVIRILDKSICLKSGEYEILED